jgi:hypothetical protein
MHQLRLNALTSADARQPRTSADRPGPTLSILRNGLRETPAQRQNPIVNVPDYPHAEKDLNVSGIYAMAKTNKTYSGPISGERSTKHLEKFTEYKFDVMNAVTQFHHSDTLRLKYQCAIAHLSGDAKQLVMKWTNKNSGTPCTMEKIFQLLAEQCKLVELDVMDIAAEVQATTAHTVSLAIQREIGPNVAVTIPQVMKGLNNAIDMRDALLGGRRKYDLISRCQFLLAAFTPPEGIPGREWMIKMREQARYTPDDNNLRKCQMDPERMIEQLTAWSDWWDKFAKTLTGSAKRKDSDDSQY